MAEPRPAAARQDSVQQRLASPGVAPPQAPADYRPAPASFAAWQTQVATYLRANGWKCVGVDHRGGGLWQDPTTSKPKPVYWADTRKYGPDSAVGKTFKGGTTDNPEYAKKYKDDPSKAIIMSSNGEMVIANYLPLPKDQGGQMMPVYQLRVPTADTLHSTEDALRLQRQRDEEGDSAEALRCRIQHQRELLGEMEAFAQAQGVAV